FFFQAEDGIRDGHVTGVQVCSSDLNMTSGKSKGTPPKPRWPWLCLIRTAETSLRLSAVVITERASSTTSLPDASPGRSSSPSFRSEERRVGQEWRSGR